jgi:hypothetical protein
MSENLEYHFDVYSETNGAVPMCFQVSRLSVSPSDLLSVWKLSGGAVIKCNYELCANAVSNQTPVQSHTLIHDNI